MSTESSKPDIVTRIETLIIELKMTKHLDAGIDIISIFGSLLHFAVWINSEVLVSLLLESGADVNYTNQSFQQALHHAASEEIAEILIHKGSKVNGRDVELKTPLHYAVCDDRVDVVSVLIESGARIESRDVNGQTALHHARSEKIARDLLDKGANIDARDLKGRTALYRAVDKGFLDLVSVLIKYGADIKTRCDEGFMVLHNAAFYGHAGIVRILLENGAEVDAIHEECGGSALFHAITRYEVDVVSVLVEFGADVELPIRDYHMTPLVYADNKGLFEITNILLGRISLQVAGLKVCKENLALAQKAVGNIFRNLEFGSPEYFKDRCREELDRMKQMRLFRPTESAYNILYSPSSEYLSGIAEEDALKIMVRVDFESVPIYKELLIDKICNDLDKYALFCPARSCLHILQTKARNLAFLNPLLPIDFLYDKILHNLDLEDLKNVIICGQIIKKRSKMM